MQMWLSDPSNVERLARLNARPGGPGGGAETAVAAAATKRRFGLDSGRSSPAASMDDDTTSNASGSGSGGGGAKKMRHGSSQQQQVEEQQREALTIAFALEPFPGPATLEFLATELGLEVKAVAAWFTSHRQRLKQLHGVESLVPPAAESAESAFDPTKFRILLAHRKMELQAAAGGGMLPGPGGFPFPGFNPVLFGLPGLAKEEQPNNGGEGSAEDNNNSGNGVAGLDLRARVAGGGGGELNNEEMMSDSGSDKNNGDEDRQSPESASSRPSRRKPAAPQWVNPEWPAATASADPPSAGGGVDMEAAAGSEAANEQPINGVCVRNLPAAAYRDIQASAADLS